MLSMQYQLPPTNKRNVRHSFLDLRTLDTHTSVGWLIDTTSDLNNFAADVTSNTLMITNEETIYY